MIKLIRFLIRLILVAGVLFGVGVVMLCAEEGKVSKEIKADMNYDAIIVLGAQVKPDGEPSVQLSWRLDAAKQAYDRKAVPIVVCGAKGADEPAPEADVMKAYLVKAGVPEKDILTDPKSFNTRQNLKNASELLKPLQGIHTVLVVTSDYHVPRSLALARDLGFEATGLGSPCKSEYWIKNHARETLAWVKYLGVKYLHLPLE